jgi:hypothetical protein
MGFCTHVLCSLATVTCCIEASVRLVTKSPKVGPLIIFSISLTVPTRIQQHTPVPVDNGILSSVADPGRFWYSSESADPYL